MRDRRRSMLFVLLLVLLLLLLLLVLVLSSPLLAILPSPVGLGGTYEDGGIGTCTMSAYATAA